MFPIRVFTWPDAHPVSHESPSSLVDKKGICLVHNHARNEGSFSSSSDWSEDLFNRMLLWRWRTLIVVFALTYAISFTIFAALWYIIHKTYPDCLVEVSSFNHAFLFSLETQTTIGYGSKHVGGHCRGGTVLLVMQSVVGLIMDAGLLGLLFVKMLRPHKRAPTIWFSKNAVIARQDGRHCLTFRVGDVRTHDQLVEAHVRLISYRCYKNHTGQTVPFYSQDMDVGYESGADRVFLLLPQLVVHEIGEKSPLAGMSAADLRACQFELVVILEGIIQVRRGVCCG